jgi:hypothetical protein
MPIKLPIRTVRPLYVIDLLQYVQALQSDLRLQLDLNIVTYDNILVVTNSPHFADIICH